MNRPTTLESLGIDPTSHGYISADLLTSGKLTALYEYAKSLKERVKELEEEKEERRINDLEGFGN